MQKSNYTIDCIHSQGASVTEYTIVDLAFSVQSLKTIPADHAYTLYAGLSRILPLIHTDNKIGIHPLSGQLIGGRTMQLLPNTRLVLRCSTAEIPQLLPLSGKQVDVAGSLIRIGTPEVRGLTPTTALRSRLVLIKPTGLKDSRDLTPDLFAASVQKQLNALGIAAAQLNLGKRRTIRIHQKEIVGYEVLITDLTAVESLALQEHGLGGRRKCGCGLFLPLHEETA